MKNKTFETKGFHLASYLCVQGVPLEEYKRDHLGRVTFVFRDSDQLIQHVNAFTLGNAELVNPIAFIDAQKRLKRLIHEPQPHVSEQA